MSLDRTADKIERLESDLKGIRRDIDWLKMVIIALKSEGEKELRHLDRVVDSINGRLNAVEEKIGAAGGQ